MWCQQRSVAAGAGAGAVGLAQWDWRMRSGTVADLTESRGKPLVHEADLTRTD